MHPEVYYQLGFRTVELAAMTVAALDPSVVRNSLSTFGARLCGRIRNDKGRNVCRSSLVVALSRTRTMRAVTVRPLLNLQFRRMMAGEAKFVI